MQGRQGRKVRARFGRGARTRETRRQGEGLGKHWCWRMVAVVEASREMVSCSEAETMAAARLEAEVNGGGREHVKKATGRVWGWSGERAGL